MAVLVSDILSKLINLEWLYIDKDCLKCHRNDNICTVNVARRLQSDDKDSAGWYTTKGTKAVEYFRLSYSLKTKVKTYK